MILSLVAVFCSPLATSLPSADLFVTFSPRSSAMCLQTAWFGQSDPQIRRYSDTSSGITPYALVLGRMRLGW